MGERRVEADEELDGVVLADPAAERLGLDAEIARGVLLEGARQPGGDGVAAVEVLNTQPNVSRSRQ